MRPGLARPGSWWSYRADRCRASRLSGQLINGPSANLGLMTTAALEAAITLSDGYGISAPDAVVLHAGSNVVVHLAPAPVVVRVMTGTAALHADPASWLSREVQVCSQLVELGAAVVPPSDELPPGPHQVDGLWLTCWAHVEVDRSAPDPAPEDLGHHLRELHQALARVTVELEPLSAVEDELTGMLDRLDGPRAAVWREELTSLSLQKLGAETAAQPIHGDASLSNLLCTTDGRRLWADFEDVRRGPVEADVAGLIDASQRRGKPNGYAAALLTAYGPTDADALALQLRLHALYGDVWRALPEI